MSSVTRKVTQSPPAIEIDGKFYRQCGEGRKQRRANAEECGEIKELTPENWPINHGYSDGFGITCLKCREKQDARYQERQAKGKAKASKSKALTFTKSEIVAIKGIGNVTVGWHGNARYWPVKPMSRLVKDWANLFRNLKDDPLLAATIVNITTVAADGKQRNMLCVPWDHWHSFWLKFGNEETVGVQREAQRVLAAAFGDTAEQVRESTQRVRSNGVLSLDLDTLRKRRDKIAALWAADDAVEQAHRVALADRDRAQQLRREAEQLECDARARKATAQQAEQSAQAQIDEAVDLRDAIEAEIERLLNGNTEYFYIWHPSHHSITPIWVDGKFGAIPSGNVKQKRKALRAGADPGADFAALRPTDDSIGVESAARSYCDHFGTVEGNDKFANLPRTRYDRLLTCVSNYEFIEVSSFRAWVRWEIENN